MLDRAHLAEKPWSPLAEAPHPGLVTAYPIARDRVVRTLSALANTYHRELHERLDRQLERIGRYYGDLRAEVEEQAEEGPEPRRATPRSSPRGSRASSARNSSASAELRRKSQLKVHLRLLNLLVIHQPKLLLHTAVVSSATGVGHRPAGVGLGPAGRGRRGRRLPRVPPSDVRVRRHPPGPARLPGLCGGSGHAGAAGAEVMDQPAAIDNDCQSQYSLG